MKEVQDVDAGQPAMITETAGTINIVPAETVKLSISVAKVMDEKTPLHAWQAHRLLGGGLEKSTEATEDGKIYEDLIFGLGKVVAIKFDDYKSGAAKATRDNIKAHGGIPVLEKHYAEYAEAAMSMAGRLKDAGVDLSGEGENQKELIWWSQGVECKGVLDRLTFDQHAGTYLIQDLKCVDDASPDGIAKAIVKYGWHMQRAAYIEAVDTLNPAFAGRGEFEFLFCEKKKPYAVNVVTLSGSLRKMGEDAWNRSKARWAVCLSKNEWPGYPQRKQVDALPWQMAQEELKALMAGGRP